MTVQPPPGARVPDDQTAGHRIDYPLVNEDLEAGSIPLSRRLRDPRTIMSIVLPIVLLLLVIALLGNVDFEQLLESHPPQLGWNRLRLCQGRDTRQQRREAHGQPRVTM